MQYSYHFTYSGLASNYPKHSRGSPIEFSNNPTLPTHVIYRNCQFCAGNGLS